MANPTARYQDPEKIPLEELRVAVKDLQDMRLAYSSAGRWREFPKDIAAQLKRAEIVLARREGELHGGPRTATIGAQGFLRGMLGAAIALPGDLYQLGKAGMGMIPGLAEANTAIEQYFPPARAVNILGRAIGENLPTSQQVQQTFTDAPTWIGLNPPLTPETPGQEIIDMGTQGIGGALLPTGLAARGVQVPFAPSAATLAKQGVAKTAIKEGTAGAAANVTGELIHQQTEQLPPEQQKWAMLPQILLSLAAGHLASGPGGEAYEIARYMQANPNWNLSDVNFMHYLGNKFQNLINRGTPQEIAMREIARAIKEHGGDIYDKYMQARYLMGLAPDPTTPGRTRYIDRPAPEEFEPTLGQVLEVPFLQHLENTANPEMAPHIADLRQRQTAGKEAVIGAVHEEGGIPFPQGDTTLTEAAQAGNVAIPTVDIAQEAFPRYAAENLELQRSTETQLTDLQAAEDVTKANALAQKRAVEAQRPADREAIIQEELKLKAAREETAAQTIREEEERSSRVLEMQRMKLKAEADQALKAAEDIVESQVGKLEGPRDIDIEAQGGYTLRQNLVQQYENVQADAKIRYNQIREESAGLRAANPEFMQGLQDMRDSAIITQREGPNLPHPGFPSEVVDQFYDAVIKRLSLEEQARAQATPGYTAKTPQEIAANLTAADLEVGDYTQLRSNALAWQRYNGATYYSKALVNMADEGMEKLVTDTGRPELAQKVRNTNAWYRVENTPFSTGVGEELLRQNYTAIPTEITYFDKLTGKNVTKTIQFQVPMSDVVAKVLDDPSRERLQSLMQATGGARQTRDAVEEMLAHRLYSKFGDPQNLTPQQLNDFRRENRTMFALLDEFGMGETGRKFADVQQARNRMAQVEAQHSANAQSERLTSLEKYEKEQGARVAEEANRTRLAQEYPDQASTRAMEDARKMTEVQHFDAIKQAEDAQLRNIDEQRTAYIEGRKKHEQEILAKYLVPSTITPDNPIGDVAAHMEGMLKDKEQLELLANVRKLRGSVRGDPLAEAAVGNALTSELWRRSNGDGRAFREHLSKNRRALKAAGANDRGIQVLEEEAIMLEMLQRKFGGNEDAMKGMTEREKRLFKGRTTQQRAAAFLNFVGGFIGANWGAKYMYEPGAQKSVAITGIGAQGGRAAGGPIARFLGGLAMRPSADEFNRNTAQAVHDIVFRPDMQEAFFDYMNNPTPKTKARLKSFYVTMGYPQKVGDYRPTSDVPAEEAEPASLSQEVPGPAPEPFP